MKNRIPQIIVLGLILLAAIGVAGNYIANPTGFLKSIAVFVIIGAVIYLIVRYFNQSNPGKRDQRAFVKAAKKSKKRITQKETGRTSRRTASPITPLKKNIKTKKKPPSHLTVIEGKKGKKKNRASF